MTAAIAPGPAFDPASVERRVRRRTLEAMRWVAVGGQALAVLAVQFGLGFELPLLPLAVPILLSVAVNLASAWRRRRALWLDEGAAAFYLSYDLAQLAALLALTGGLLNPFSVLILTPVTVSASLLSPRATSWLAVQAVAWLVLLAFWHLPLPWAAQGLTVDPLYLGGLWVALAIATVFIAAYVAFLAVQRQRLGEALAAAQAALAREQRLAALGGLAAATAHELGSPLSTIAVVAHELLQDLPADSPWRGDLELLKAESDRCARLLGDLAARPEADGGAPFNRLPISALLALAAERFRDGRVALEIAATPLPGGAREEPLLPRDPGLLHGLGTLIQNATQFARRQVVVTAVWDAAQLRVRVCDDGPGFDPVLLQRLGEPYLSTGPVGRYGAGPHMGLGIFIALALLGHSGARLDFGNRTEGGAEVAISWPLSQFLPQGGRR